LRLAFLSIGRHIHTERWIRWFADRGDDCHLLTVQPGEIPGVTVHDIQVGGGPKPWRYWTSLGVVRARLGELAPDLLNTHFLTGYGYWGHFSGFHPNVLTVWGDDVYVTPFESPLKGWLARRAVSSCDALTGDSTDILDVAAKLLGARPDRSFRILWGVDFERFRPRGANSWRRALGFADEDLLYFSARSYTQPYYNIDIIIEAAARIRDEVPQARFLFAGYEGDPTPFLSKVEKAGLADVTRVLGRIPHEEFSTALNACDVFLSVPSVDATAVSLLEAMASGCAIIVSDLPSSLEWVRDGESALVVAPRDVAGLAEAMKRYARLPQERLDFGARALARAHEVAGFEANMQLVADVFTAVLDADGTRWPRSVSLAELGGGSQ